VLRTDSKSHSLALPLRTPQ